MSASTAKTIKTVAIFGMAFFAVRMAQLLPREEQIKRQMRSEGKLYGIDWVWKEPESLAERFFGLQQAVPAQNCDWSQWN